MIWRFDRTNPGNRSREFTYPREYKDQEESKSDTSKTFEYFSNSCLIDGIDEES